MSIEFLDTTLRDGAQAVGISFSEQDKSNILNILDDFGIDLIEGGEPASNPKDFEFFKNTNNNKLCAFGATRRINVKVEEDSTIKALLESGANTICIVGKSSAWQASNVLGVSPKENLEIIKDTIKYIRSFNKRIIFDAEHFFDAYQEDNQYAISVILAATNSGADTICLCDTNGGTMPDKIYNITKDITRNFKDIKIGIHAHNDCGMAVANALMAVSAGATHVQGTFLGFGERCGNANLSTIIANLSLKEEIKTNCKINLLTKVAYQIAEICNIKLDSSMPYVGSSAFSHKAGMHADAVLKNANSFEHINPALVGNKDKILLSEISGKSAILNKLENIFPSLSKSNPKTQEILDAVKLLEMKGYQFEEADGSFVLLAEKIMEGYKPAFDLDYYKLTTSNNNNDNLAEVSISVNGKKTLGTSTGNGPVNALDKALRSALESNYPQIKDMSLIDYKVRVIDSTSATEAIVRVSITSKNKTDTWTTIGVSTDIIEASWSALKDSFDYMLSKYEL